MFVTYFLIKVEITLLNNVNLTDCFTSTLRVSWTLDLFSPTLNSLSRLLCWPADNDASQAGGIACAPLLQFVTLISPSISAALC